MTLRNLPYATSKHIFPAKDYQLETPEIFFGFVELSCPRGKSS
jgi:hypothetical protein